MYLEGGMPSIQKEFVMSAHQLKVVFEQFPWLNNHFGALKPYLSEAMVSRAGVETLELRVGYVLEPITESSFRSKIFLFDRNGELISTVHGKKWYHRIRDFFDLDQPGIFRPTGKSLEEALTELGERARACAYVVLVVNHWRLVVFREPKGRTICDLLKEKEQKDADDEERAREEIRKEMLS